MSNRYSKESLSEIERVTLGHYESNAASFWQGTRDHDVSQNIDALLSALPQRKGLDILDFGCGPGRDLHYFKALGHSPTGLDGSETFCEMARLHSGCPVLNQSFCHLDLGEACFDGIFANASMFHVPSQILGEVLSKCYLALKPNGILFTSNPRGAAEGWNGERFGHYMELEVTAQYLEDAGFRILDHYYRPAGLPCAQQPWLAIVSQR